MPYFITDKSTDCSGWATVKEDGTVIGCHESKQDAVDQMVAVSLAEDMSPGGERNSDADEVIIVDIDGTLIAGGSGIQKNVDYVNSLYPDYYIYIVTGRPESDQEKTMQELADAGVQFNDIQFNEDMSIDTAEYKKQTAADILEENPVKLAIDNDAAARRAYASLGIPTKDPKAIKADGTDTSRATKVADMEQRDLNENFVWTGHQQALYAELEDIAETFGQFDQTSGGDGAHYFTENPFKAEGLMCANCAFYDGSQGCDLVSGIILPDALCKFWIIPADLIQTRSVPLTVRQRELNLIANI